MKNHVSRAFARTRNAIRTGYEKATDWHIPEALYVAGTTVAAVEGAKLARQYKDAFSYEGWKNVTNIVEIPYVAIGLGLGGSAVADIKKNNERGIRSHWLEYAALPFEFAPAAAPIIAAATDENALYALALTGAAAAIGFGARALGTSIRQERRKRMLKRVSKCLIAEDISFSVEDGTLSDKDVREIALEYLPDKQLRRLSYSVSYK